jgi:hypothetical protein
MYMHVRRDGTSTTDSLWFFGGLSLGSNQGNRYFDFEMYQTNIQYNTATHPILLFIWFGLNCNHNSRPQLSYLLEMKLVSLSIAEKFLCSPVRMNGV